MITPPHERLAYIKSVEAEYNELYNHIRELVWNSNGSLTWNEALIFSPEERNNWMKFINKKLEQKSGQSLLVQEKI